MQFGTKGSSCCEFVTLTFVTLFRPRQMYVQLWICFSWEQDGIPTDEGSGAVTVVLGPGLQQQPGAFNPNSIPSFAAQALGLRVGPQEQNSSVTRI